MSAAKPTDNRRLHLQHTDYYERVADVIFRLRRDGLEDLPQQMVASVAPHLACKLTRRGKISYLGKLILFFHFCREHKIDALKPSAFDICRYLRYLSDKGSSRDAIRGSVSAIRYLLKRQGTWPSAQHEIIYKTSRGLRQNKSAVPPSAKNTCLTAPPQLLIEIVQAIPRDSDRLLDMRDRALLLCGYSGAMTRPLLIEWSWENTDLLRDAIEIKYPGLSERVAISRGPSRELDPVDALKRWKDSCWTQLGELEGPVLRRIDAHGHIWPNVLSTSGLTAILRNRAFAAGFDPTGLTMRSLRLGFLERISTLGLEDSHFMFHSHLRSVKAVRR